jgi:hypothetical protein
MHRMKKHLTWAHNHLILSPNEITSTTRDHSHLLRLGPCNSLQVRSGAAAGQRRGRGREQVRAAAARRRGAVGAGGSGGPTTGRATTGSRGLSTDCREAPPELGLRAPSGAATSLRCCKLPPTVLCRRELPPVSCVACPLRPQGQGC